MLPDPRGPCRRQTFLHFLMVLPFPWNVFGTMMHAINMFDRKGALTVEGFEGSGADWEATTKPLIEHDNVVISSPQLSSPECRRTCV